MINKSWILENVCNGKIRSFCAECKYQNECLFYQEGYYDRDNKTQD